MNTLDNQVNTLTNDHFGPQKYNIMALQWQLFFQFLNYAYNYGFDFLIWQFLIIFCIKTLSKYDFKFNPHIWKEINYAGNVFLWQKTSIILKK